MLLMVVLVMVVLVLLVLVMVPMSHLEALLVPDALVAP